MIAKLPACQAHIFEGIVHGIERGMVGKHNVTFNTNTRITKTIYKQETIITTTKIALTNINSNKLIL